MFGKKNKRDKEVEKYLTRKDRRDITYGLNMREKLHKTLNINDYYEKTRLSLNDIIKIAYDSLAELCRFRNIACKTREEIDNMKDSHRMNITRALYSNGTIKEPYIIHDNIMFIWEPDNIYDYERSYMYHMEILGACCYTLMNKYGYKTEEAIIEFLITNKDKGIAKSDNITDEEYENIWNEWYRYITDKLIGHYVSVSMFVKQQMSIGVPVNYLYSNEKHSLVNKRGESIDWTFFDDYCPSTESEIFWETVEELNFPKDRIKDTYNKKDYPQDEGITRYPKTECEKLCFQDIKANVDYYINKKVDSNWYFDSCMDYFEESILTRPANSWEELDAYRRLCEDYAGKELPIEQERFAPVVSIETTGKTEDGRIIYAATREDGSVTTGACRYFEEKACDRWNNGLYFSDLSEFCSDFDTENPSDKYLKTEEKKYGPYIGYIKSFSKELRYDNGIIHYVNIDRNYIRKYGEPEKIDNRPVKSYVINHERPHNRYNIHTEALVDGCNVTKGIDVYRGIGEGVDVFETLDERIKELAKTSKIYTSKVRCIYVSKHLTKVAVQKDYTYEFIKDENGEFVEVKHTVIHKYNNQETKQIFMNETKTIDSVKMDIPEAEVKEIALKKLLGTM